MIIELFGLPGSGKSTLARALQEQGVVMSKIKTTPSLIWYNILFFLQYPKTAGYLFVLVLKHSKPWSLVYMKFMNAFLQHNAKYMYAKKFSHAGIDQGHLQNILSLFEKKLDAVDIAKYIQKIPLADHVVVLQLSEDVRKSRLENRGFGPREHMDNAYVTQWKEVVSHNYMVATEVLREFPETIFVNAEVPIENMVADVQSHIV